jgi:hypothetical protein
MRKTQVQADWVLQHLSFRQISRGVAVDRPERRGSKILEHAFVHIKGTGTPTARLQKWIATPSDRLSKAAERNLSNFFKRFQYQQLRASGASTRDASRLRNREPTQVKAAIEKYNKCVDIVHKKRLQEREQYRRQHKDYTQQYAPVNDPERYMIVAGFQDSDIDYEDWEEYVRSRGRSNPSKTFSHYKDQ